MNAKNTCITEHRFITLESVSNIVPAIDWDNAKEIADLAHTYAWNHYLESKICFYSYHFFGHNFT